MLIHLKYTQFRCKVNFLTADSACLEVRKIAIVHVHIIVTTVIRSLQKRFFKYMIDQALYFTLSFW